MKVDLRKSTKLVIVIISSLLIASVSATVYNYMYQDATIGVEAMALEWLSGADATDAGTQIDGVTASLTNMKGPPNGTREYTDPLQVNNTGASSTTFDVLIDSISGDTGTMDSVYVRLYNVTNSASMGTLTVWSSGAQGSDLTSLTITAYTAWRFQWDIKWKANATVSETMTVNLRLRTPAA